MLKRMKTLKDNIVFQIIVCLLIGLCMIYYDYINNDNIDIDIKFEYNDDDFETNQIEAI